MADQNCIRNIQEARRLFNDLTCMLEDIAQRSSGEVSMYIGEMVRSLAASMQSKSESLRATMYKS